jgi:glycosyltransferase involved in cell wall biosynthesis
MAQFKVMIKVSVIIPTYQPGYYLFDCLDRLNCQTLEKQFFEILVVLNGPKEPYYLSLEEYIHCNLSQTSIRLLYIEESGVSLARNLGIVQSQGEQIAFIDDDDLVSENYLDHLLKNSSSDGVVISNLKTFDKSLLITGKDYYSNSYLKNKSRRKPNLFKLRGCLSSVCAKLISRQVIGSSRFNPKFKISEDSIFMFEISKKIKRVAFASNDTIYFRRIRAGSASRKKINLKQEVRITFKSLIAYLNIYLQSPIAFSTVFFISRELAVFKTFLERINIWFSQRT